MEFDIVVINMITTKPWGIITQSWESLISRKNEIYGFCLTSGEKRGPNLNIHIERITHYGST